MSLSDEMKLKTPKQLLGEPTTTEQVEELELSLLDPFENHPFKVLEDNSMTELVESISEHGIATPIIVRPKKYGRYEIVAGHRRVKASEILGLETIQGLVRDLNDEEAIFYMVDTNLQREQLLPSEKAFAYKMKLEALKKQGKRTDLTCTQVGYKLSSKKSVQQIAENSTDSRNQIQRFIRLTELTPNFLDLTDSKKLPFNVAVELSYLSHSQQEQVAENMAKLSLTPSLEQATKLKKYSKEDTLTEALIESILSETKDKPKKTSYKLDTSNYFPKDTSKADIEAKIIELLENWKSQTIN